MRQMWVVKIKKYVMEPRDYTRLTLKLFRKKFYQKIVSLVKLFFLRKSFL